MTPPRSRNAPCPCGSGRKYKNCCLPKDRLAADAEAERRGPVAVAAEHPWEAGIFPLPTVIGDQPGRRVSVVLVTAAGIVLHHDILTDSLGRVDEVADALESALDRAGALTGVPPRRVAVRHRDVARALGTRLVSRGIEVDCTRRLTGLEDAARSLCRHMVDLDVLPLTASAPTWKGWGLSGSQCRSLFAAAARFRRAAPWKRLGDEPITVYGHHGAWTAAVMGTGREAFGLTVYTDGRDYEDLGTHDIDMVAGLEAMNGAMISVSFEPRGELTREMQREVAAAGWEVADSAGYPVVLTFNTPAGGLDPVVAEVLAGILLAIPDFLDACDDQIEGGLAGHRITWEHEPTGLRLGYELPGGFEWPIPDHLAPGGPEGNGAEADATIAVLWPDDTLPDVAVVEAFEAHLRGSVSGATAARHAGNAAALIEFLNGRHGVPIRALHEYDLRTFLYSEFPRSRPGHGRTESLPASLRKFFAFLAERDRLEFPWADDLLRDKESIYRRVRTAPAGAWWDEDVQDFRADVWADLDRRALLLPIDWAGALEPDALTGIGEARIHHEAQRRWLSWRDALIRDGIDSPDDLLDALGVRLLDWLDQPDPEDDDGRTRLAAIRGERTAIPADRRSEIERVFLEVEEGEEE